MRRVESMDFSRVACIQAMLLDLNEESGVDGFLESGLHPSTAFRIDVETLNIDHSLVGTNIPLPKGGEVSEQVLELGALS
jgi:hypothetical protein